MKYKLVDIKEGILHKLAGIIFSGGFPGYSKPFKENFELAYQLRLDEDKDEQFIKKL